MAAFGQLSPDLVQKLGTFIDAHGEDALAELLRFGDTVLTDARPRVQRAMTRLSEDVEEGSPATLVLSVDPSLSANRKGERSCATYLSGSQPVQLTLPVPGLRSA